MIPRSVSGKFGSERCRGKKVRVAIIGVGNCASSLVQGVEFYKDAGDDHPGPGLMHSNLGGYSLRKYPFPGEALGCAMNVFRRCEIKPTQTVAIVGVGFLGAILTALAVKAGAYVVAISRRPFALEIARQFGAEQTIELNDHEKVLKHVQMITGGTGCHCVIEAAGTEITLDLAGELTRERGRLVTAGYHQDGCRTVNIQLWNWRGLDVTDAHERDPRIYVEGMKAAVDAVSNGRLDPSPLYTHQFGLDGISCAFTLMQERPQSFLKGLVTL